MARLLRRIVRRGTILAGAMAASAAVATEMEKMNQLPPDEELKKERIESAKWKAANVNKDRRIEQLENEIVKLKAEYGEAKDSNRALSAKCDELEKQINPQPRAWSIIYPICVAIMMSCIVYAVAVKNVTVAVLPVLVTFLVEELIGFFACKSLHFGQVIRDLFFNALPLAIASGVLFFVNPPAFDNEKGIWTGVLMEFIQDNASIFFTIVFLLVFILLICAVSLALSWLIVKAWNGLFKRKKNAKNR